MGKITVETCEIEGLKIITPAILRRQESTRFLYRITSPLLRKASYGACTFKNSFRRINLSVWCGEKFTMWPWICGKALRPLENGMEYI